VKNYKNFKKLQLIPITCGCCVIPRDGIVNRMRIESKYKYKYALRAADRKDNLDFDDKLSELYLAKSMDDFWI